MTENAAGVLPYVTSRNRKYRAKIYILYVLKGCPAFGARFREYDPAEFEKMREWEKQTAELRLDQICEKFLLTSTNGRTIFKL